MNLKVFENLKFFQVLVDAIRRKTQTVVVTF